MTMPQIYLSPPHMSGHELELVQDAFASSWIAPLGPHVDAFERELAAAARAPRNLHEASLTPDHESHCHREEAAGRRSDLVQLQRDRFVVRRACGAPDSSQ